ncbi:Hypothetical protein GLP15_5182 [Giardia lamblia P15]|uniref:Uncharacterized protein n=1 Tax=Giardia intestinalis (strain P15) TaxID=658858 RepID=E1EWB1_GIAIA|nr:Hypothetical protein GLP15_5182 [Giardia lamblia P15]
MQSILTTSLLKPFHNSKDAQFLQLSAFSSGELLLFSYTPTSSYKSDVQQGSFLLFVGTKNEELYNEPGQIVCYTHDLSQIARFFDKKLHIHVRSSTNTYPCTKIYSLNTCVPKFASLITLNTGQSVVVVLGVLVQKLSSEEASKYFSTCSHQDPVKIAASYTFLYILHRETGAQINSFLIPIKRKNSIADIGYDTAGLLHIYYRNSKNFLLKLTVKPLEFYNLEFTKDTVSLLDSRGESVRPLSPSITQSTLRLEALHASRINASEPLFGRLSFSSLTLHMLCDYVNAKCICHVYEEDSESTEVYTLFSEVLSDTAIWISSGYDKLYYVSSCTPTLQVLSFSELMEYILQKKQSLCRFTWTSDNAIFFKGFCESSSSLITLISREDFEVYLEVLQNQQWDVSATGQSNIPDDSNVFESTPLIQDFSVLSNSVVSEFVQERSDPAELDIAMECDTIGTTDTNIFSSPFDNLSARVLTLEEALRIQSADHRKLIKELEEFYDAIGNLANKQAKLSRKLDDLMETQIKGTLANSADVSKIASIGMSTTSKDQAQTLGQNLKTLVVTLYQIVVDLTGFAVKLVKQFGSKLSTRKNI